MTVLAGIEAGGTKFVCAVGTGPQDLAARTEIPTTAPPETLARVVDFFERQRRAGAHISALGVASFGPLDLSPRSPTYGRITTTTKAGWAWTDLAGVLGDRLALPVVLDTDVNGAAYGEVRWGAGRGLRSVVYLTVGTGIGGGAVIGGEPLRGMQHPEMGHVQVERFPGDDFAGVCPFHGGCLEGLASGPAIAARTGRRPELLSGAELERVVRQEAWYIAQLVTTAVYLLSPERIVVGGGVLNLPGLIERVRACVLDRVAGALTDGAVGRAMHEYVVPPALGASSGVLGALGLAAHAVGADPDPVAAMREEASP